MTKRIIEHSDKIEYQSYINKYLFLYIPTKSMGLRINKKNERLIPFWLRLQPLQFCNSGTRHDPAEIIPDKKWHSSYFQSVNSLIKRVSLSRGRSKKLDVQTSSFPIHPGAPSPIRRESSFKLICLS